MLFSCSCMRKLSYSCYEGRGKAKTKGEKLKSEKKLSSAGRQLAVEGTHRKWQDKHENIHEDHRSRSYAKITEHIQENRRNRRIKHRNTHRKQLEDIGTPSPPPGQQLGCRFLLNQYLPLNSEETATKSHLLLQRQRRGLLSRSGSGWL